MEKDDLTLWTSKALNGATVCGHQAANSSIGFVLFRTFVGPIFEIYATDPENLARKKYHTISFYSPVLNKIVSVEIREKIKIEINRDIHTHIKKSLTSYPTITPYKNSIDIEEPIITLPEIGPPQ